MKDRESTAWTRLQIIAKFSYKPPEEIDDLIEWLSARKETGAEFCGEFFGGPQVERVIGLLRRLRNSGDSSLPAMIAEEIITRPGDVYAIYSTGMGRPKRLCQVVEAPEGVEPKLVLGQWLRANGLSPETHHLYQIDFCPVTSWQSLVRATQPSAETAAYYAKK